MRSAKVLLVLCCLTVAASAFAPEREVAKKVIDAAKEQGLSGRPVANVGEPVKVSISLNLNKIISLDSNDFATVSAFFMMKWNDPVLTWDPAKNKGVDSVSIPATSAWRPDIVFYNNFHRDPSDVTRDMVDSNLLVMPDGTVFWVPRLTLKMPCKTSNGGSLACTLLSGSWAYDTTKIGIEFENGKADINLDDFDATPGLDLISHSASFNDKEYACCPGVKYRQISFELGLKCNKSAHCDKN